MAAPLHLPCIHPSTHLQRPTILTPNKNPLLQTPQNTLKSTPTLQHAFLSFHHHPSLQSYSTILELCASHKSLSQGQQIHAHILKSSPLHDIDENSVFLSTKLLFMYGKCGSLHDAHKMFDGMSQRTIFTWNALIGAYASNAEESWRSLELYSEMRLSGTHPDACTFASALKACGVHGDLGFGLEMHGLAIKGGYVSFDFVVNSLIAMYARCGELGCAWRLFKGAREREDVVLWNTIISGCSQSGRYIEALGLFREMQSAGVRMNSYTVVGVLQACAELSLPMLGREVHAALVKSGRGFEMFESNALVVMYAKSNRMVNAVRVFEDMEEKDNVSWNSVLSGYVQSGSHAKAVEFFHRMIGSDRKPDSVSIISVASASGRSGNLLSGREIHAYAIKRELDFELEVGNTLIDMYTKCKRVAHAKQVFQRMPIRDSISWTTMIAGYAQNSCYCDAIDAFREVQRVGVKVDSMMIGSVLLACSGLTCLPYLKQIHAYMFKHSLLDRVLGNSIIDVYGDCGEVEYAIRAFENIENKDIVCWTSMISCYVHNGLQKEALELFYDMKQVITEFDEVILVTILTAIANLSLLKKGKEIHGFLIRKGFTIDGTTGGALVDMYSRWEEVENVRLKMKERGLVKNPACSWIEVGNKLHSFVARDRSHPNSKEIYMKLNQIMERLEKEEGYVGDTKFVLHNVSEEEKLKMLHGHSERLAIAFGLIGTSEGTPIRITKNLRVCGDCHRFTQLVSKLFERVIIVRDANRFHHFKGGSCSCGGFW
ncbi:Pentatricopeptide repeat-containing protein [Acorus calamus]|uniref:Pentatricopeptide repeat-containing protein n=1 Tax=Acorus calamus TaxID=4465 RepID=A0AAV9D5U5_ACOCL|nr:Pentatricopeptide repeat-containing protein [Acorus calamus]